MTIRVRLFGPAAVAAGAAEVVVRAEPGATCTQIMDALSRQQPALASLVREGRLAVNHAFAPPTAAVREHDEVALIALVGGG